MCQPPKCRTQQEANIYLVLGVVNLFIPGVGAIAAGCVLATSEMILYGILQLITTPFFVGIVWSIVYGIVMIVWALQFIPPTDSGMMSARLLMVNAQGVPIQGAPMMTSVAVHGSPGAAFAGGPSQPLTAGVGQPQYHAVAEPYPRSLLPVDPSLTTYPMLPTPSAPPENVADGRV